MHSSTTRSDRKRGRGPSALVWLGVAAALALGALGVRPLVRSLQNLFSGPVETPNVLLITVDTLRADRLGCYGYAGAETPTIDALAARGARFRTAVAQAPLTTPSHASILTGLTPVRHGVRDNGGFTLPEQIPTLGELFRQAGYSTAAFVSGFPLDRRFGLDRGFETYDDRLPRGAHGEDGRGAYVERLGADTTAAALSWLERQGAQPWLLWVHYFDPHAPYAPPGDFARRFALRPYDGEIAVVDQQIRRLLRLLEERQATDRTIVLVTADHGESLGEHGEDTHGVFVYDATLKVPWIVAGPGVPGVTPETVARGIDVMPTLIALAGIHPRHEMDGRSLAPAIRGQAMPDEPAYAESLFARLHLGWAPLHAWRTARWKYIEAPRPELYALDRDASETRNLAQEPVDSLGPMRQQLRTAMAARSPAAAMAITRDSEERLRALGYIGGAIEPPGRASLRDPKDGIELANRLERGIAEAREHPELAERELAAVLADDPNISLARRHRAIALASKGDHDAAAREIRELDRRGAASAEDLALLADSARQAGRPAEALEAIERAARAGPKSIDVILTRGRLLAALDRPTEAVQAFRAALAQTPGHAEALRGLADLAMRRGDVPTAERYYSEILAGDNRDVGALVRLGVARATTGRLPEAIDSFTRAVEAQPRNTEALAGLGAALAKAGRPAEAIPFFERALDSGARTTAVLNGLGFAQLEAGDQEGALAALRASLALDPRQGRVAEVVATLRRR